MQLWHTLGDNARERKRTGWMASRRTPTVASDAVRRMDTPAAGWARRTHCRKSRSRRFGT